LRVVTQQVVDLKFDPKFDHKSFKAENNTVQKRTTVLGTVSSRYVLVRTTLSQQLLDLYLVVKHQNLTIVCEGVLKTNELTVQIVDPTTTTSSLTKTWFDDSVFCGQFDVLMATIHPIMNQGTITSPLIKLLCILTR
jgi:hypothetical protein